VKPLAPSLVYMKDTKREVTDFMNKRIEHRKQGQSPKRRIWTAVLSLLLLLGVTGGSYALIEQNDQPDMQMKEQAFSEKNYAGFDTKAEEIEVPAEEAPPVEGTVEDAREDKPAQEEPVEEIVVTEPEPEAEPEQEPEPEVEPVAVSVEAPEKDLDQMIANAQTHVYTLYTDLEQGSGFLYNDKGDILTNAHVVKDASYVMLKNSNGQEFNGQVIGFSETTDVALVRVKELAGKQPMPMASEEVAVGTKVVAIGSPEDQANTATEGEITAVGKSFSADYEYNGLYEMTAILKKGSSGGPLINAESESVIGINSIILEETPELGYAIPIHSISGQLAEWISNPIEYEEEEVVLPDVKDAYFDEALLTSFIEGYYELLPYALNDPEMNYYESYLLPDSEGAIEGKKQVEELRSETRTFDAVKANIARVEISKNDALIEATAEFIYHDTESGETLKETHHTIFTVVIDEYGDYQIQTMRHE
jgi:serine protease Do